MIKKVLTKNALTPLSPENKLMAFGIQEKPMILAIKREQRVPRITKRFFEPGLIKKMSNA